MEMEWLHPGFIFLIGVLLIPVLKGRVRTAYLITLPIIALIDLILTTEGVFGDIPFSALQIKADDFTLVFGRVDNLSIVFGYIFVIASLCMIIYALNERREGIFMSAFIYVGSALGVVFAGDLISLYIFWEIMAFSSLFLIWYRETEEAHKAGFRYILWHLFGGCVLLAGIIMYAQTTGSIAFNAFTWGIGWDYLPSYLILLGFSLNAAIPPLHAWLSDAYPEATVAGAVFLTAFTTKSAIYVLLRGFPGIEILIWLGAIMAIYGIIFAILENDIRRLLAYSIISQGGYMVAGVGMGVSGEVGETAVNGAIAHAFCCVLYMALLFMAAGAVLEVTGKSKLTELGGLYRFMPRTFWLYMIGAFSISGFPLFSGFVSKTMVVEAAAAHGYEIVWLLLECAAIGTFLVVGLKLPYFTFFSSVQCEAREPPKNMLFAMGIVAFLCVFIGIFPQFLYGMLPYAVHYEPYAPGHVISTCDMLIFTFVAFWMLRENLRPEQKITLDTDWLFRILGRRFIWFCEQPLITFAEIIDGALKKIAGFFALFANNPAVASRMLIALTGAAVLKPLNMNEKYVRDLEQLKRDYPEEMAHMTRVGFGVLLSLMFLTLYLFIYLSYGVLWR